MTKHSKLHVDIVAGLDVAEEYRALGVEFTANSPNGGGYLTCWAADRPHGNSPSAGVNLETGRYKDFGGTGESLGLFDFAVRYGKGRFKDWRDARRHYANKAGMGKKLPKKDQEERPQERFKWVKVPLFKASVIGLCRANRGVTAEALQMCGAQTAYYPANSPMPQLVVTLPIFGPQLHEDDPRGFVAMRCDGGKVEIYRGAETEPDREKKMTVGQSGLMGSWALQRLQQAERVYKVEGVTDMLALQAFIPPELRDRHLVLTNACGTHEYRILSDFGHLFAGLRVDVIHDADVPGQDGAAKWSEAMSGVGATVRNVQLPYEISDTKGQDLRDWINEGHAYEEFLAMCDAAPVVVPGAVLESRREGTKETAPAGTDPSPESAPPAGKPASKTATMYANILRDVRCLVVGLLESTDQIVVFSQDERRTSYINQLRHLKLCDFLMILGENAADRVSETGEEADKIPMRELKNAIAATATKNIITDDDRLGAGVWEVDGVPVLVGCRELASVRTGGKLDRTTVPVLGNRLVEFASDEWYPQPGFETYLQFAQDRHWCQGVLQEAVRLFRQWDNFKYKTDPELCAALVLATWVQSTWDWRPIVAVAGNTNTGKTTLVNECIAKMFGKLAVQVQKPSEAAVRGAVRSSAKALFIDEFENSPHRARVLELLRTASRGGKIPRSTPSQRVIYYGLKQLTWVASTETGMDSAPDRNRLIMLDLADVPEGTGGKIQVPDSEDLEDLGHRLLAVALTHYQQARQHARQLKPCVPAGIDRRVAESFSVPVGMLAAVRGLSPEETCRLYSQWLLERSEASQQQGESDQARLLLAIWDSSVRFERWEKTVGELLHAKAHEIGSDETPEQILSRNGLKAYFSSKYRDDRLFVVGATVRRKLLKDQDWRDKNIDQLLLRIPGAVKDQQRIGGKRPWGVSIPLQAVCELLGSDEEAPKVNGQRSGHAATVEADIDFPENF